MYCVIVLVKLYLAARPPDELHNVIKLNEAQVESYIDRMIQRLQSFIDKDPVSPHTKFLFVMKKMRVRFNEIQRGESGGAESSKAVKVAAATAKAAVNADGRHRPTNTTQPDAMGLHALSEAAMIGNQQQQQRQPQSSSAPGQQTQEWYSEAPPQLPSFSLSSQAYQYAQPAPLTGLDNFDFGAGGLGMGMGMDGSMSGLFMADGLWNSQAGSFSGWM